MITPYYEEAGVTLYCGYAEEVLPTLAPGFEICITDPPYNCGKRYGDKSNDNRPWPEWVAWWDHIMDMCWPLCEKGVWASLSQTAMRKYDRLGGRREATWTPIWNKPFTRAFAPSWLPHYEVLPHWGPGPLKPSVGEWIGSDVLTINAPWHSEPWWNHPTTKPIALMKSMVSHFVGPVLDPFAGTGTTARACKDLGISCTVIEVEERHCETIVTRMTQEVFVFNA